MKTLIGSVIVFMLVVMLHELGHFTVAKLVGIKVNEFSIGMGPKIFQKQKCETKYSLRALPIGGYVAMEGEDSSSDDPRSFENVSIPKRMAVVVAGALMNFILAIVAFFIVSFVVGIQTNNIGVVVDNSPAYYADLKVNDKVISINGEKVSDWNDIINDITKSDRNKDIDLKVERNNKTLNIQLKPQLKDGRLQIGIGPKYEKSFIGSIKMAFVATWDIVKSIFTVFGLIFSGKFSLNMLSGPVGVISVIGQETSKGIIYLIQILAIISANLGVVNLLPIPALDGGKLLFLIIEGIIGRPINEKVENTLSVIGFALLIGLMLYVTVFGDLARIIGR